MEKTKEELDKYIDLRVCELMWGMFEQGFFDKLFVRLEVEENSLPIGQGAKSYFFHHIAKGKALEVLLKEGLG
jgi:hypothetical protein